jgi:ubiquinone/menaquinone biosynthesis C-methylase UbiE
MTDRVVNVEQAEEWDGRRGDHWVEHADRHDALSQRITPHLMEAATVGVAERVLDVGCGCGLTTRAAARAAPSGSVLGVDLSSAMLAEAERRARAEHITNVSFEQGDAQVRRFARSTFDVALSRFGVMFFEDPVAAFANIGSGLRVGGRLAFVCWQDRARNEWITVPTEAALAYVAPPDAGAEGAPGAFSLADPERVRRILTDAGLEQIDIAAVTENVFLGDDAADATEFWEGTGMARALLEGADPDARERAIGGVRDALEAHERPSGTWLGSEAWLVTAIRA